MPTGTNHAPESDPVEPVLSVRDSATLVEAASSMERHHVGSLVVVDESGHLVGIVTERDIIAGCTSRTESPSETRVTEVMTKGVVSIRPGTPINVVHELMVAHRIRHLPVVDDGVPVGMMSARDVMASRLEILQGMRDAAQQIAMLSKNARKLDFQEIMEQVRLEVPSLFGPRRWALYLDSDEHRPDDAPLMERANCPCSSEGLADRGAGVGGIEGKPSIATSPPPACQQLGADGCCALIPLPRSQRTAERDREGGSSYLCMCGLPETAEADADVLRYKMSLVANILTVNLANAKLQRAASRDTLTGLRTRSTLEEALQDEYSRGLRHHHTFSVAMLDIDHFKDINDTRGHAVGDAVLRQMGEAMLDDLRTHDVAARYGGDEASVLMPETTLDDAVLVIERLRGRLERELRLPAGGGVTVSCGVAEWSGLPDDTGFDVLRRADEALYEAKRAGRNQVVSAAAIPATG